MLDASDRSAILDLISSYSYGYDTQDWELFASIWADDAVLTAGDKETWSAQRIVEVSRTRRETLAAEGIQTRHSQTNTLLTEDGDTTVLTDPEEFADLTVQLRDARASDLVRGHERLTGEALAPRRITGRTIAFVAWQRADEHKPVLMHTGEYLDEFVQVDGHWRISRREIVIDHIRGES